MKHGHNILVALAALTVLACAEIASAQARTGQTVDVARQLRLKLSLVKVANNDSLAMSINRQEWDRLTPDERDKYRREALAFLSKSPEEQAKVIERYEKLIKMTAARRDAYLQRAQWLHVVVESFSTQERDELTKLPPDQRAKRLLERKAELIKQGKLAPETQPASSAAPE